MALPVIVYLPMVNHSIEAIGLGKLTVLIIGTFCNFYSLIKIVRKIEGKCLTSGCH